MSTTSVLVTFLVSLLVGGLGIFLAARIVADNRSYGHAVITALVGALAWGFANAFLRGIPVIGPVLPLLIWIAVIKWRYGEGWVNSGIIGVVAWIAAAVALEVLPVQGVEAIGIPFV